jgi:hypothetical protein
MSFLHYGAYPGSAAGASDCIVVTAAVIFWLCLDLLGRTMILLGYFGDVAVRFVLVQTIVALLNVMG